VQRVAGLTRPEIAIVIALAGAVGVACNASKKPDPNPGASGASASGTPLFEAGAPSATAPRPPAPACRAMQVSGKAGFQHGLRIQKGSLIDGKRWLVLEEGAMVELRHTTSTRGLVLKGPGLILPCIDGDEDVLIARGVVETSTGAGVRPGAEVRIGTPFGTLTYGDAAMTVNVSKTKLDVSITGGGARLTPMPSAGKKPRSLDPKHLKLSLGGKMDSDVAKSRVEDCEAAADKAEAQARQVITPSGDAGALGERAALHVRLRGAARLECLSARAAVFSLEGEGPPKDLEKRLDEADRRRTRVPSR